MFYVFVLGIYGILIIVKFHETFMFNWRCVRVSMYHVLKGKWNKPIIEQYLEQNDIISSLAPRRNVLELID